MKKPPEEGCILLVNKPYEWTSYDVVRKLRYKFKIKKIGHAGTLDPLATGLLILCSGKMTKKIEDYVGMEKEYTGKFVLGQSSASHDLETELSEQQNISHLTDKDILEAVEKFTGKIQQLPPIHSAIKIDGRRAYKSARRGQEVILRPREVEVKEFKITSINLPELGFRIVCTKGTYIRSFARDLGEVLGVGAYLSELCRTRIGNFKLEDAKTLEEITYEDLSRP